jgi:multisubunit Na+/H+ antiporter MnhF subunit
MSLSLLIVAMREVSVPCRRIGLGRYWVDRSIALDTFSALIIWSCHLAGITTVFGY